MITISVWDGKTISSAQITIKVKPVDTKNVAPTLLDQGLSTLESIDPSNKIGQVYATDLNFDELTFTMIANDNDLFDISENGRVSLAEGKALDYKEAAEHAITVGVSDTEPIGNVLAIDPEKKNPSFTLTTKDNDLFAISKSGELGLAEGMMLDFEDAMHHSSPVTANNGNNFVDIPVTIIVEKVVEK